MLPRTAKAPVGVPLGVIRHLPLVVLGVLSVAVAVAVLGGGGFDAGSWSAVLLLLAGAAAGYGLLTPVSWMARPVEGWTGRLFLALMSWVALQMLPLPLGWADLGTAARAAVLGPLAGLDRAPCCASLSLTPLASTVYLVRLAACGLVYWMVRELGWRLHLRIGLLVAPLVAIGGLEAALGFAQYAADPAHAVATGTYLNRNHFAGLLEMALPFVLVLGWREVEWERGRRGPFRAAAALRLGALACVAACLVLAQFRSLSRLGAVSMQVGVAVLIVLLIPWRRSWAQAGRAALLLAGVAGLAFALMPQRLMTRYTGTAPLEDPSTYDVRFLVWRDTARLVSDFPVFGTGAGSFGSVFPAYQREMPQSALGFAHNDYLQAAAELGLPGAVLFTGLLLLLLAPGLRAWRDPTLARRFPDARRYGVAAVAALSALLLHSVGDYNLYVPANALVVAWIAGLAAAADPRLEETGER